MTIAFDPALAPQLPGRSPGGVPPLAQPEAGIDFATLLADRALLDAPASAMMAGAADPALAPWTRRERPAPAALRFDEGPLFGRAVLPQSLAVPGACEGVVEDAAMLPAEQARVVADGADSPVGLTGHGATPMVENAPIVGAGAGAPAPAPAPHHDNPSAPRSPHALGPALAEDVARAPVPVCSPGRTVEEVRSEAGGVVSRGGIAGRQDVASSARVPACGRPEVAAGDTVATLPGRIGGLELPDRAQEEGGASERSRQFRARFVDQLGPVQVMVRAEGGAVQLTARVALAAASVASLLERRLRQVVAEEGVALSALRINGEILPAKGRI